MHTGFAERRECDISRNVFLVDVPLGRVDNVDTIFTKTVPKKFVTAKIVENSARFLTTYDFDLEYLLNGSTFRKPEKLM